jgi:hypothetical protein
MRIRIRESEGGRFVEPRSALRCGKSSPCGKGGEGGNVPPVGKGVKGEMFPLCD